MDSNQEPVSDQEIPPSEEPVSKEPDTSNNKSKWKIPQSKNKLLIYIGAVILVLIAFGLGVYFVKKHGVDSNKSTAEITKAPSPTLTPIPSLSLQPTSVKKNYITNAPTVTSASKPTSTTTSTSNSVSSTSTPAQHVSNPPQINITYPSDGQSITMNSQQTFCVVDVPAGGDTSGLQRKQNINNAGWTSYSSISTLCYTPANGSNTLQLQYKNQYGDESSVYSRQFTFQQTN